MVTRTVTWRDPIFDELVKAAEERHISINWLVNQLVEEGLERILPPDQFQVSR